MSQRLTDALSIGLFGLGFLVTYDSMETEKFKKVGTAKECTQTMKKSQEIKTGFKIKPCSTTSEVNYVIQI